MCEFHSFLYDCYTGRIFDEVGVTSHSEIAERAGVNQDEFLLPEFYLPARQLEFDGKWLNEVMNSDFPGDLRIGTATRSFLHKHDPWNQQALDRLERYLKKNFGSAERLVDFVEPQWEIAGIHCGRLLKPEAFPGPTILAPKEGNLSVDSKRSMVFGTVFLTEKEKRVLREHFKNQHPLRIMPPGCHFCWTVRIQSIEGNRNSAKIRGISVSPFKIPFDDWKKLFLKKENRIPVWQEDLVEILV